MGGPRAYRSRCPAESRLERNSVAAFLLLVKNFLRNHTVNQESLVQCHGPAIIAALLHKVGEAPQTPPHRPCRSQGAESVPCHPWQVPGSLLDMSTLMASQILMEQVASEGSGLLLHLLYQHLLFDFRIWSNSDFAVRLGGSWESWECQSCGFCFGPWWYLPGPESANIF